MLVFFVVLVAGAPFLESQAHPLSVEDKEKLFNYHTQCLASSFAEEELVAKFCMGEQVDDPKLKEYLLCVSKQLGFQNESGELQIEVIRTKLAKSEHNSTGIEKLVEKCALPKESELETAFNMFKCYRDNCPNKKDIFFIISITPIKRRKLQKYHRECSEQTNVDEDIVKKTREGEFPEDPSLKNYLLCIAKKLRFQDTDGKIQKDVIVEKLTDAVKDAGKVNRLVELCVFEKESPESTAHSMMKCLADKSYVNFLPGIALPPEKLDQLFRYHRECKKQTSVDKNLVIEASVGNFTDDTSLKEYFLCMTKKVGFQDEEGVLQKEVLRQKVAEALKDPLVSETLLDKCAVQEISPADTAYNTVKCYFDNSPNHINIFQTFFLLFTLLMRSSIVKTIKIDWTKLYSVHIKLINCFLCKMLKYYKNTTFSAEKKERYSKYNTDCMLESGLDSKTMEAIKTGAFPDDERFRNHLFCFFKKVKVQNEAGDIETKRLKYKIGKLLGEPALSEKLIEKCAVQMDRPTDTAYKAFICYYESTASRFNIFSLF